MIYAPVFAGKLIFLRLIPHDSISSLLHIRIGFLELYLQPCGLRGVTLIVLVFVIIPS
jgi:hypothetical protein